MSLYDLPEANDQLGYLSTNLDPSTDSQSDCWMYDEGVGVAEEERMPHAQQIEQLTQNMSFQQKP